MSEKDITLLLVEDDDIDAEAIYRSFKKNKIINPIKRAKDGLGALELLEKNKIKSPYIILLDLNMPRMGGIEFLKVLRANKKYKRAVVFVLTTSSSDKDIVAAYDEHIAGYFVKNEMNDSFFEITQLFQGYWKIVSLPKEEEYL